MRLGRSTIARRRLLGRGAILLALPLSASTALATPYSDAAEEVVERLVQQVWTAVQASHTDDLDRHHLQLAIEQETDLGLLGRLVLGRYWRTASPSQRDEYLRLFRSYVVQVFVNRLRPYAGRELGALDQHFQIVASRPAGKRDVLVHSRILPPTGQALEVHWRLRHRDDGPVIIDAIVEGISLLVTQRSEFATVLERDGLDGLLSELRSRVSA
jgi:phospholipid transport system substrate-binding protein